MTAFELCRPPVPVLLDGVDRMTTAQLRQFAYYAAILAPDVYEKWHRSGDANRKSAQAAPESDSHR